MNIALVSPRRERDAEVVHEMTARLASDLVSRGHSVEWLALLTPDGAAPTAPADVELVIHRAKVAPYRDVLNRIFELGAEALLTERTRAAPPSVVHFLGFGGVTSVHLPWITDRLGVPTVVSVDAAEALCHRGTLVDETGSDCDAFDDPARCTECCLVAGPDGLTGGQARIGRLLRGLGDLSPYPNRTAFENRLDSTVGSLYFAHAVVVADGTTRERLQRLGVSKRVLHEMAEPNADALLELYRKVTASGPSPVPHPA